MKKFTDFQREVRERRERAEPWAIGKRCWNRHAKPPYQIDTKNYPVDFTPDTSTCASVVVDANGRALPDDVYEGKPVSSYLQVLVNEARDYVPWGSPIDWPGVISVIHPAAWTYGGPEMAEAIAKRFNRDVHVYLHGTRWMLLFLDEPSGDFYNDGDCQWWALVHPNGVWKNLAAS